MTRSPEPGLRLIRATAPVRICDLGGWTDTWFAGHGAVCAIAVTPGVEVELRAFPRSARPHWVAVHAENYGERFVLGPDFVGPPAHSLLAATLAECPPPPELAVELRLASAMPPGCSTGTSAAVCVALLAALHRLRGEDLPAHALAAAAHRVETQRLGLQSGIQDQLCAAHGGVLLIEMDAYPQASVSQVPLAPATRTALARRLLLVYLGRSHHSSAVHEQVIARLQAEDGSQTLAQLRQLAYAGRDALCAGDLDAFGATMRASTTAQAALHPELISREAWAAVAVAQAHGALGWKINGAGGAGGSLTLLCDEDVQAPTHLGAALVQAYPQLVVIPIALGAAGARAWEEAQRSPSAIEP